MFKPALIFSALSCLLAVAASANTTIVGDMTYDPEVGVKVAYTLSKPAIVTFDIETNVVVDAATTNWVSIGYENYHSVSGALNCIVTNINVQQEIFWAPFEDWPVKRIKAQTIRAVVTAWSQSNPPDYCVININRLDTKTPTNSIIDRVRFYRSEAELPGGLKENATYWTTNLVMRRVHAAGKTFRMGSPWTEMQGESNYTYRTPAEEATTVTFSQDYWLAIFPITCRQGYLAFGNSGNHSNGDKGPMTGRRWSEFRISAVNPEQHSSVVDPEYNWPTNNCAHPIGVSSWFGKMKSITGVEFDFPTEAQWEFACRAGTTTPYSDGTPDPFDTSHLEKYQAMIENLGWYKDNSDNAVHPVMGKSANAWGFYDMHGNVLELCLDHQPIANGAGYNARPIGVTATDYPGPVTGTTSTYGGVNGFRRIAKGGKYSESAYGCRSASRGSVGDGSLGNPGENAARPVAALTFKW